MIIKNFQISKHFNFYAVTNSAHYRDLVQNNRIEAVPFILTLSKFLIEVIDPLVEKYPHLEISSGFRGPELNREVGGVSNSRHTMGLAVDIKGEDWNLDSFRSGMTDIAIDALRMGLPFHKLIMEERTQTNSRWIHISGGDRNRKILTGIDGVYRYKELAIL